MQTSLISQAILTAAVAALKMATSEEDSTRLTPAELRTLIDDGMTEGLMESLSSVSDVYINIAELDDSINALTNTINALTNLKESETKPYDLADLKKRINYARSQQEKHQYL